MPKEKIELLSALKEAAKHIRKLSKHPMTTNRQQDVKAAREFLLKESL